MAVGAELTAGFPDSRGGDRGRSAPREVARLGCAPTVDVAADVTVATATAAAPAIAAITFEGELDGALLIARALSRACAWVPPPLRAHVGEDGHGRPVSVGTIGVAAAASPRYCAAAAAAPAAASAPAPAPGATVATELCGLRRIGETRLAGGGCCSSQPPGSSSLFHLPLTSFKPSSPMPPVPPPPPPSLTLPSDIESRAGEKAPPRRRTQGATSGDAAGFESTADPSVVIPSEECRTAPLLGVNILVCCCRI